LLTSDFEQIRNICQDPNLDKKAKLVSVIFIFVYKVVDGFYKTLYYYFLPALLVLLVFTYGKNEAEEGG